LLPKISNVYKQKQFILAMSAIVYTILSVVIVSLVSLVGIVSILIRKKNLSEYLLLLVSLSAGTLFGGAFLHLLPEVVEHQGFTPKVSLLLIGGVLIFFLLEKFIHWRHCHGQEDHVHKPTNPSHIAPLNLVGDALHNLLDGLVIAGAYLVSIPAGVATTVAVIFHEVPQEIADFLSAAVAIVGAIIGLILGAKSQTFVQLILPFAAGGFVYIAGSNLIPELHKECSLKDSFWHFAAMVLGIAIMVALLLLEG
jgi:zinc and cadmium transporter